MHRLQVVKFEKTVARAAGALAFSGMYSFSYTIIRLIISLHTTIPKIRTVLPVLDEDIAPAQIYASSLGITYAPTMDTVLAHLLKLTSQGESLDRWNAAFSIKVNLFRSTSSVLAHY